MIFSLLMILLVFVVVYFHYLQGFFSATLSAIFVVVAAAIAIGWHETVIVAMLKGKYADQATAMVTCVLFATVYIVLRLISDRMVPGNLRLPVMAEKLGGAAMGLVAGLVSVGLFAFAAQSLPFGPALFGYSRMPLTPERYVIAPPAAGRSQQRDAHVFDELQAPNMNAPQSGMLLPADDLAIGLVSHLSNGALSTSNPLSASHPDWLLELFGQRLGVEVGGRRTALNIAGEQQVQVGDALALLPQVAQRDGEFKGMRNLNLEARRRPGPGQGLLVVPTRFTNNAADGADRLVRFSPGSVRLVANGRNYFPIGTLDSSGTLIVNQPDDFLFASVAQSDATVAFVFEVELSDVVAGDKVATDVFLEAKRFARVDLTDRPVQERGSVAVQDGVMRKPGADGAAGATATPATPATPTPAPPAEAAPADQGRDVMPVP
ncbi:MAG TPA: CvpA family protein [Tepidisphaeraceae bacterium]|jgi:hypothetical protein|nr:CvpA family protein [Tepidisphaeraceae bacterium]